LSIPKTDCANYLLRITLCFYKRGNFSNHDCRKNLMGIFRRERIRKELGKIWNGRKLKEGGFKDYT
jgi:hypothetical protein